jgi:hypothetical protein
MEDAMVHVKGTIVIGRSPAEVFDFVADAMSRCTTPK